RLLGDDGLVRLLFDVQQVPANFLRDLRVSEEHPEQENGAAVPQGYRPRLLQERRISRVCLEFPQVSTCHHSVPVTLKLSPVVPDQVCDSAQWDFIEVSHLGRRRLPVDGKCRQRLRLVEHVGPLGQPRTLGLAVDDLDNLCQLLLLSVRVNLPTEPRRRARWRSAVPRESTSSPAGPSRTGRAVSPILRPAPGCPRA